MITVGWLLYAILLVIHFVLAVPGILLMVSYWDDDDREPKEHGVHRTLYLFIEYMLLFYCAVWVFGLIVALSGAAAAPVGAAVLIEGVVDVLLFLFMLFLAVAASRERSYRRG